MSSYTFYGFTNTKSTNLQNCLMFYEDYNDQGSLHTYSTSYYQSNHFLNEIPMKFTDFEYIVKVIVDTNQTYIVRSSKDIIKNFQTKGGRVDYDIVIKHLQKHVKGFILYDINVPKKTNYIPYMFLPKKCIISAKLFKKRIPFKRLWISMEDCNTYNNFQCVDSQSCVLKFSKNNNSKPITRPLQFKDILKYKSEVIGCESSETFDKLPLSKLNKILIPYKYYAFTE